MTLRFSANLGFLWPDRPLIQRIEAAARAGFKAVEMHWPYDVDAAKVWECCSANGCELLGVNTPLGNAEKGDFGLGAQAGREAEFRDTFVRSADYAREAGASSIHVMAGVVSPDVRERAKAVFIENLAFAVEAAADLTLLLEPINQRDKPGYFYSDISTAADIIAEVGASNVRIMFDVYHVAVSEGDVLTRVQRHLPQIGHVQIAAVPSRCEPDEGEIAYGAIFTALERLGYSGWIGCEYKPRAGTDEGLGWLDALGVSL
ncbi:hydroxypyruvate isomerase family protein [Nitratireductor kimnyeongensis]|uniref:Hydroxypyruvate isomerase family protein n=1 Tax=Nitratireductor kimnyeongensis TaxID=430679 RepID=A0ABW0TEG0_9HYPH|nr:TIM barrel protein [Nitratireductor kimnyeongensis]QZZ36970.1 TIM barrel protein [Nitratireductor kimnyeongensis]